MCIPRRGLPHPLRSVCAVFHDLDGLPLSEPSGVFRPVTLMGFSFRSGVLVSKSVDHLSRAAWKTMLHWSYFCTGLQTTGVILRPALLRRTIGVQEVSAVHPVDEPDPHVSVVHPDSIGAPSRCGNDGFILEPKPQKCRISDRSRYRLVSCETATGARKLFLRPFESPPKWFLFQDRMTSLCFPVAPELNELP